MTTPSRRSAVVCAQKPNSAASCAPASSPAPGGGTPSRRLSPDDRSYAETYTRLRHENEKLGQRRVRQVLGQKGVSSAIVDQVVTESYAKTNEEALGRQYLERKRLRKPQDEKETARVMRRLVAAGFSMTVIYRILRQWDVPEEALSALDDLTDEHQQD
jgi:regulatory protein